MLPKRRHKKGRKLRGIPKTVTITKIIIIISKNFGNLNNNNNNKHDNDNNNIAGHPNNKEFKIPSGGQVSDSFLLSLRPRTKMP